MKVPCKAFVVFMNRACLTDRLNQSSKKLWMW